MIVFSPAGLERFFLEAGAPAPGEEAGRVEALEAARRHGWEFVTR